MPFMEQGAFRLDYEDSGSNKFVTSDEDVLIWPELSAKVQSKVPGSRLLRVPNAGHSTYFEEAALFNQEVGKFLQAHRPA